MALPGNTFLHKILPTLEWQWVIYGVPCCTKPLPGLPSAGFIREFGSGARRPPMTFLVEFKQHKH